MMDALRRLSCVAVLYLLLVTLVPVLTRAQTVDVGGLAYLDYYYTVSSPTEEDEGLHGFTYRRLYLTTDFTLSEDFRGRARLEANEGSSGPSGPVPFVKDLYLTWAYAGEHSATFGVAPPPAFEVSENVWGYRSLEKTILDLQGIVGSRDVGIRFEGPLAWGGRIRYAGMLANNSGTRVESDPYKRAYVQIAAFPTERLAFTVGADHAGYADPLDTGTRFSGFAGYSAEAFRLGLEGYWYRLGFDNDDESESIGLSLFGAVRLAPAWEMVARIDRASEDLPGTDRLETFFLGGVSYAPNAFVRLIPNIWIFKIDESERDEMLARMTVEVTF